MNVPVEVLMPRDDNIELFAAGPGGKVLVAAKQRIVVLPGHLAAVLDGVEDEPGGTPAPDLRP